MRFRSKVYVYLAIVAIGILANFLLWRYRLHLYELDTDYEREPLQSIQMFLFRGTQAFMAAGLVLLVWWKFSKKKLATILSCEISPLHSLTAKGE